MNAASYIGIIPSLKLYILPSLSMKLWRTYHNINRELGKGLPSSVLQMAAATSSDAGSRDGAGHAVL